jgi:hypothetical protein
MGAPFIVRASRGGSWYHDFSLMSVSSFVPGGGGLPLDEFDTLGFRVASVPEPSTALLGLLGAVGLLLRRRIAS